MKRCRICEEALPPGVEHSHPLDCLKFVQAKNRALAPALKPGVRVISCPPEGEEIPLAGVVGEVVAAARKDPLLGILGLAALCTVPFLLGLVETPSRKARKGHP